MNEEMDKAGSERRAIMAVLASLVVFWLWSTYLAPKPPPTPPASTVVAEAPAVPTPLPVPELRSADAVIPGTGIPPTPVIAEQTTPFSTSEWQGQWSTRGGGANSVTLPAFLEPYVVSPIYMWAFNGVKGLFTGVSTGSWHPYVSSDAPVGMLTGQGVLANAGGMDESFSDGDYVALEASADKAVFQRVSATGLRITKTYEIGHDAYQGKVTVRFENVGVQPLSGRLWVGVSDVAEGKAGRYDNLARPTAFVDRDLETEASVDKMLEKDIVHSGPVSWLGIASRYFLVALVPSDPTWGQVVFSARDSSHAGSYLVARDVTLSPGQVQEQVFDLYVGPKELGRLKAIGHDLGRSVQFGKYFGFFASVLLSLLQIIHIGLRDWGLSIIGLTCFVKLAFFPLTAKAFRSSKEMQKIQPLLAAAKEKYKDDKEMQTKETMRLMSEHKVNPMGGCLPTLIQLPVWIALYSVLLYSVDLYHTGFLVWKDLSAPDPFAVLPLIVGALMFWQTRQTPMTGMDPAQAKMMQLMPLIFVFFTFSFPSGLALYILVNSVLTILQQWLINRNYRIAEARAA